MADLLRKEAGLEKTADKKVEKKIES